MYCNCKAIGESSYEMCKEHFEVFSAHLEENAEQNKLIREILDMPSPWEEQ